MNKTFEKYLVLICILLFGGYTSLHAHADLADTGHLKVQGLTLSKVSSCSLVDGPSGPIFSASSTKEFQKELVAEEIDTAEEEEEIEKALLSHHKEQVYGSFSTAVFYALLLGYFSVALKKITSYFRPHIFTASYKRHIRFQVFRI